MALVQLSAFASLNGKGKEWLNGTTRRTLRTPLRVLRIRVISALQNPFRPGRSYANLPAGSTPWGAGSDDLDQSREVEEGGVDDHLDRLVEPACPIISVPIDVEP